MSTLSKDYLSRAAEMRRRAETEKSPQIRAELLQMAHGWEAMAKRRAGIEATEAGRVEE